MSTRRKAAVKKTRPRVGSASIHRHQAEVNRLLAEFKRSGATTALPDQSELRTIMLYVAQGFSDPAARRKFFNEVAEKNPLDFLVFLLFPWVAHEDKNDAHTDPDEVLLRTSIKTAVMSAVKKAEKDPSTKTLLLEYFKSFAPYAVPKPDSERSITEVASPWAPDSKLWAKATLRHVLGALVAFTGEKSYHIKYNDVTDVEQAYWSAREERRSEKLDVLPTIRLNALPFAESAILHRMDALAQEHGVNLELVEVPWDKVALALLTNRIDAAFYNPEAIIKQFRYLKHEMDSRIVFRTSKDALLYKVYYILAAKTHCLSEPKIAHVTNSDHENVLKGIFKNPSAKGKMALRKSKLPITRGSAEKFFCPVDNPDEAVAALINGSATHCLTGGIHHSYVTGKFGTHVLESMTIKEDAFENRKPNSVLPTRLSFFTVARSSNDARKRLQRLEAIWAAFVQDWSRLCDGPRDNAELEDARRGCLEHVNRDPSRAFVDSWDDLKKLIRDHCNFPAPDGVDLGGIESVDIP